MALYNDKGIDAKEGYLYSKYMHLIQDNLNIASKYYQVKESCFRYVIIREHALNKKHY